MAAKANYVTLSHCLGKVVPLTMTKSTLAERIAGISITEVPRTFRDAVRVTHLLGFKYLWIDSLCIVQDSNEDWEVESSQMQDVYEHAPVFFKNAYFLHGSYISLGTRWLGNAIRAVTVNAQFG
jgi:hypothetical protein